MTQSIQHINFPVFTTPLIGRDNDVASIVAQLRATDKRFVTLIGTSGTGKTRLSLQIASAMEDEFQDGMAFVSLAPISEPELVIPTIARTFNVTESGSSTYQDALTEFLRPLNMLIILDNLEQVLSAAAGVAELIRDLPGVRVLGTSQVSANIPEELALPIPPLALPEATGTTEAIASSPAVALFVDRMRQVQPYFQLNEKNTAAVVELCRRLNGLPLAIELVATHSDRLQPEDLLLLLRAYLPRERSRRSEPSPEQVIFPVLTWCIAYGPASVRWLLPRLGVLRGDWRAEQVTALSVDHMPNFDLAATLTLMVNKGLLLALERNGEPIFTMLDVIRQFAVKRLEADEKLAHNTRKRHMHAFALLAEQIDQGFRTGDAMPMARRMTQAMPNIRAAIQWAFDEQQYDTAATIIKNLTMPGYHQGYIRELLVWVERLAPFEDQFSPQTQLGWFYGRGLLHYAISNYDAALQAYDQALERARELGDLDYMARLLNNSAIIHGNRGNYAEARAAYEQALLLRQQEQNIWAQAVILNNLGIVVQEEGDLEGALRYQERGLALREELNDDMGKAASLLNIADIKAIQGEYDEAEGLLRQTLAIHEQLEEGIIDTLVYQTLGVLLLERGRPEDREEAQTLLRNAVTIASRHDAHHELGIALIAYADWLTRLGEFTDAARVLGAGEAQRELAGAAWTRLQQRQTNSVRTILTDNLGAEASAAAEQAGAGQPVDTIVELVYSK